jgi:hypothetical protein
MGNAAQLPTPLPLDAVLTHGRDREARGTGHQPILAIGTSQDFAA